MISRTKISPYKDRLDKMVWSFSRVNSYETCPKMFKMVYLDKNEDGTPMWPEEENAFGLWGTHCHECLEKYYKGELLSFELLDEYEDNYDEQVYMQFPPNKYKDLNESYHDAGTKYFSEFEDLSPDWEVVGVEQKIQLDLGGRKFVGYIDLVLRSVKTGEFVIVDHKSRAKFSSPEELEHYSYQPYLYSQWVFETYGMYPTYLIFNMFRIGESVRVKFTMEGLQKALQWFHRTVDQIYQDTKFEDKIVIDYRQKGKKLSEYKFADYFCHYICGPREYCRRNHPLRKKKEVDDYYG